MQGLAAEFLYPAITRGDLQGQITAAQVEEALTKHPDIAVVILTSPTYEGIVSDVAGDCGMLSCTRGGADCR